MEDETDHIRRNSRAHTTVSANPPFQFHAESSNTSKSRGKMRITDMSTPWPENETPQLKLNKHPRNSSNCRGKRISSSFEATGVLCEFTFRLSKVMLNTSSLTDQPHNSVSDTSLYKHIDVDLPDSERIRQLLIWSSLRAAATPTSSSQHPSSSSQPPPPPPLPPLSAKAVQVLKSVQEDIVKMLAEKRIDLSLYSPEADSSSKTKPQDLLANEQNVRNRQWEVTYSDYIKQSVFSIHELRSRGIFIIYL